MFLTVMGVLCLVDGLTFSLVPEASSTPAYDWAKTLLPGRVWGVLFLVLGATAWIQLQRKSTSAIRRLLASLVLSYSSFALSIGVLSFHGERQAWSGSAKWFGYALMAAYLLWRPILADDE